jgi:hypothetical protein
MPLFIHIHSSECTVLLITLSLISGLLNVTKSYHQTLTLSKIKQLSFSYFYRFIILYLSIRVRVSFGRTGKEPQFQFWKCPFHEKDVRSFLLLMFNVIILPSSKYEKSLAICFILTFLTKKILRVMLGYLTLIYCTYVLRSACKFMVRWMALT